jgi:ABC-type Mn2+/Zn2+ transport system permease subunit
VLLDFVAAWPLFHNAFLTGWLLAALLGLAGVLVVARDQIFIGAAVAQASTLGIALALCLDTAIGGVAWLESDAVLTALAVAAAVTAALVTTRNPDRSGTATPEALTGWVYLFAASAGILLVARSPHGLEEVHRLLSSTIIGASLADVGVFGVLLVAAALVVAQTQRPLLLLAVDPLMAAAVGVPVRRWNALLSCALGLLVGLAIPTAGVLYAFGCLVLPPLIARNLCREMQPMFVVAPVVAVATSVVAFVVAHHYDLPPAQATVALLCLLVAGSGGVRRALRGRGEGGW